ncbi:hypothetical protein Tco_0953067 [Tanacetum coccineum]|uniref:Uncharacterized protein n=1 Tax=Tanacetum coccineum TaxID=301880 RepID=A0ABQ5DYT6_9ASTR
MLRSLSRMRKKTGESVSNWVVVVLLNDDIMESLFGCDLGGSEEKEEGRKSATIPMVQENTVLNPKKSQSATILLRALIVTREEGDERMRSISDVMRRRLTNVKRVGGSVCGLGRERPGEISEDQSRGVRSR